MSEQPSEPSDVPSRDEMEWEFEGSKTSKQAQELTWTIRRRYGLTVEDVAQMIDKALQQARDAALEEAAKVCDEKADYIDNRLLDDGWAATECAKGIRAAKGK